MLSILGRRLGSFIPQAGSYATNRLLTAQTVKSTLRYAAVTQAEPMSQFWQEMATVGIRREDKSRWERRVPLSPDHVQQLVDQGIDVIVQPSTLRIFDDEAYQIAGAKVQEDLSSADVIVSVKEVPMELLIPDKTYLFFSHTIKAQRYNMPMLDNILQKRIRLIDYERIVDERGQRLVRFGRYAGIAGMIDMLRALGNRLLYLRHSTPFLSMGYAHMYVSLEKAKQAVQAVGEEIALKGVPQEISPMIFVFTGGEGSCSQGAREIFELLPHKYVTMEELPALARSKDPGHRFRLYGCVLGSKDYMAPNDPTRRYDKNDYYNHPENYHCVFADKVAPYASVIVNNTYWDKRFPRLLTTQQFRKMWKTPRGHRLIGVADISCDVNGSIEMMTKTTSIDEPLFVYDPETGRTKDSIDSRGIMFLAVDNLPTELPKEASEHFGDMLVPFLPAIAQSNPKAPFEQMSQDLPAPVYKAVVTAHGKLTPPYSYIAELRKANEKDVRRILVLGAGMVTPGLVATLEQDSNLAVTIAALDLDEAKKLAKLANVTAVQLDADRDPEKLNYLVQSNDVIISVLPQFLHTRVAEACIKFKKHMLTASYIKPEMKALDERAKEAGVVILNEIGLDPGIDHMSAIKTINEIYAKGGKVVGFRSICGGLPAPEYSDNPFHYKFSWNPRGVLEASKNPAKYIKNGELVSVEGDKLMENAETEYVHPCFLMEVLPNRDSTSYIEPYGLKDAKTVFRGTLRYKGYSSMIWALKKLGLMSSEPIPGLNPTAPAFRNWPEFIKFLVNSNSNKNLRDIVEKKIFNGDVPEPFNTDYFRKRTMRALDWLGFFDTQKDLEPIRTPIDTLCKLLIDALAFKPDERDMVLLQHTFDVEWKDGKTETLRSTLIAFGDGAGETAMSKTVGYPLGIAAKLIANGKIKVPGVLAPTLPDIYQPILDELREQGIVFVEESTN